MKTGNTPDVNKWRDADHVKDYLTQMAGNIPHKEELVAALLEQIPLGVQNVLDLGTGDGRLLWLVLQKNPNARGVGLDFSEPMLELARKRFQDNKSVQIVKHDLNVALPNEWVGGFDLVVSGLAIHHVFDARKRELYAEVFDVLVSGGVFLNLEHISSPSEALHEKFLVAIGKTAITDDPSNKLLDVFTQLDWLREIGFGDVDCFWKWLEVALFGGTKP